MRALSLRTRLIATLLALAAAGMLVLGAVTYATQRSFLLDRVDDQTLSAIPALDRQLELAGAGLPGIGDLRRGGPRGGHGPGGPRGAANLPPGTFGQRRSADGEVVGSVTISYGEEALAPPQLPERLEPGTLRTVGAERGDLRYRVRVLQYRGGGMLAVAVPLAGVDETLSNLLLVEALVMLAVLLGLGLLADSLVRVGLRPLDRIADTAGDIAGGDLSHRVDVVDERTEVGRVGAALNAMLGRLETAFAQREASEQKLRRFLADASHELRTPLASIRGYAELHRMGAASDPDATARSMGRIEDEAARMGVLVEDLLKLARLDELREITREPVALADLVDDVVADVRATGDGHPVRADVVGEPVVDGDRDQLQQVLLNLVRNALVHTPDGTAIEVAARTEGDRAVLEVRDHGPGLPPGDPALLFERFWRAEGPGRLRGRAGAGLGLSIVAGIVAAHGGEVEAGDAPGGGARFVVRLPQSRA